MKPFKKERRKPYLCEKQKQKSQSIFERSVDQDLLGVSRHRCISQKITRPTLFSIIACTFGPEVSTNSKKILRRVLTYLFYFIAIVQAKPYLLFLERFLERRSQDSFRDLTETRVFISLLFNAIHSVYLYVLLKYVSVVYLLDLGFSRALMNL